MISKIDPQRNANFFNRFYANVWWERDLRVNTNKIYKDITYKQHNTKTKHTKT